MRPNLLSNWKAFLAGLLLGGILSAILFLVLPLHSFGAGSKPAPNKISQKETTLSLDNGPAVTASGSIIGTPANEGKINLNTAGLEELVTLPGIGEAKAKAIIAFRDKYGLFQQLVELLYVPGIGESVFSGIKDLIYIQ